MIESLPFKLTIASGVCIAVLLPFYYLLGYSVLNLINSLWHYKFKQSFKFKFEDVLVASLAILSLIAIACKIVGVFPQIKLIWQLSTIAFIICLSLGFITSKIAKVTPQFPLPSIRHSFVWLLLFSVYALRSLIKARSLDEAQYIPSRFNTDIFLYIRRSIVFLSQPAKLHSENNETILDILYNSPKLLSTLVYTTFTKISGDIGIAATIATSMVLAAIVLKYLLLIKTAKNSSHTLIISAAAGLIIFQPVWCWLQDQFYWSNLLCIYLLVYTLQDLFTSKSLDRFWLIKYAIAGVALAGFYPSQIPFFCLAAIAGVVFQSGLTVRSRNRYLIFIVAISIAVLCLFYTQYLDTGEVVKHFDLTDAKHGQNLNYIPFWSFLSFVPKTGGTPKDLGAILLISGSLLLAAIAIRYCLQTVPDWANWFKLLFGLYFLYSVSYLLLPGEYRQSKFFFTYIVPLIAFCFIKVVNQGELKRQKIVRFLLPILAVFVTIESFDKPYKPHVSSEISPVIAEVKTQNKPLTVYTDDGSIAHGYYYFAYQLRQLDWQLFTGCPQSTDLESITGDRTLVIARSCPKIVIPSALKNDVLYPDINGDDN